MSAPGWSVTFIQPQPADPPDSAWPHGYWLARTDNGMYDRTGNSPSAAMAQLLTALLKALARYEPELRRA